MNNLLPPFTEDDMEYLKRLPKIQVPAVYKSPTAPLLPYLVDNSTQPYMRPVFSQIALECGQASGVGYNFTYEMNYRRNVPGNLPQNQYPTHYVWNFSNNGASTGVSFLESWEIIRGAGTVNVADYGGMNTYGANTWLSGYDYYYNAMKNRVDEIYAIPVKTAEDIQVLKHWIHDHLEGAAVGGVATFAAYATNGTTLAGGTPEGGKCVTINWTPNTNHQLVIVGYNDSIRYDFNGDGQYTNTIDINGDGVVDVSDWEIGGVKWVNSFGTGVGNGGYCYTMYKNLADPKIQGGIWNNMVYVVIPKPNYEPRLTFKVKLKHDCRSKIKAMAGVSLDTTASAPFYIMEFPIFNYQGGDYFMQGGTVSNINKSLEFGLDVTPLLSNIPSGQKARFFLMINEKDADNTGTGSIETFSLIDYTPAPVEVVYPGTAVPLTENGLTMLSINKAVNFPVVNITNTSLPEALLYQAYSQQLSATGGTPPYDWEMVMDYDESMYPESFPSVTAQQLTPSNNSDGYVSKTLDFSFPFYGKTYNRVVVRVDGYMMFDDQTLPWPFIIDETIYQRNTRNISPFMSKQQTIVSGDGDGLWYQGDENSATFRWKTSIYSLTSTTDLNYAVRLYPNGLVEFYYGNLSYPYWLPWVSGISNGDLNNFHVAYVSGSSLPQTGILVDFNPAPFPLGFTLSKTGLLQGMANQSYAGNPIKVMVRDKDDIRDTKTLPFTTKGIEIRTLINSGGDSLIQYGETASVGIRVKNASSQVLVNPVFRMQLSDPFITLSDSIETHTTINPGDTAYLADAFHFEVATGVPDNHAFTARIFTLMGPDTMKREFSMNARSPKLSISNVQVMDAGNGYLDPGETCNVMVSIVNKGGATANNLSAMFTTTDSNLTFNSASGFIPTLTPNGSANILFNLTVNTNAPLNYLAEVHLQIDGNNQVSLSSYFYLMIGFSGETFESGGFSLLDWHMSGTAPWFICDSLPYQGQYCAQSGDINDNQESIIFVQLTIQTPGNVGFYRRVSCEADANNHNYDYLAYYVDGVEKARWDGEQNWAYVAYNVGTGFHTFKWNYHKDYSVSTGKDAAWVDQITFPPFGDIVIYTPQDINDLSAKCSVVPNPFRFGTSFLFRLNQSGRVNLSIYSIQGEEIIRIADDLLLTAGDHNLNWNCSTSKSGLLNPGIYLYRLSTPEKTFTGKLIKY